MVSHSTQFIFVTQTNRHPPYHPSPLIVSLGIRLWWSLLEFTLPEDCDENNKGRDGERDRRDLYNDEVQLLPQKYSDFEGAEGM
jgi:hypothetical protein